MCSSFYCLLYRASRHYLFCLSQYFFRAHTTNNPAATTSKETSTIFSIILLAPYTTPSSLIPSLPFLLWFTLFKIRYWWKAFQLIVSFRIWMIHSISETFLILITIVMHPLFKCEFCMLNKYKFLKKEKGLFWPNALETRNLNLGKRRIMMAIFFQGLAYFSSDSTKDPVPLNHIFLNPSSPKKFHPIEKAFFTLYGEHSFTWPVYLP